MDRRINYLARRLDVIEVIDRVPADRDKVFFGATVTVENEEGETFNYRIVGADEIDASKGWISVDSPMARALIGRSREAGVAVAMPGKTVHFVIIDIVYST
jgi:transcription elongation factor GreB